MPHTFHFADAFWFRVPLKALVLTVAVFAFVSLYPALSHGSAGDHERAAFGLVVVLMFIALAVTFAVAINDSYVELDADTLSIRFEAFFGVDLPLSDIVAVRPVDPRPRWRYRFGLSTNFEDRIACSHGGNFIEIELARPRPMQLWPRQIAVTRFWLAVREHESFLTMLTSATARPAAEAPPELALAA